MKLKFKTQQVYLIKGKKQIRINDSLSYKEVKGFWSHQRLVIQVDKIDYVFQAKEPIQIPIPKITNPKDRNAKHTT